MSVSPRFRIRGARVEAGLTQQALANEADVVVNSVCRWESGATQPSVEDLGKTAKALGVDPGWLAYGSGQATDDKVRNARIAKAMTANARAERKRGAA